MLSFHCRLTANLPQFDFTRGLGLPLRNWRFLKEEAQRTPLPILQIVMTANPANQALLFLVKNWNIKELAKTRQTQVSSKDSKLRKCFIRTIVLFRSFGWLLRYRRIQIDTISRFLAICHTTIMVDAIKLSFQTLFRGPRGDSVYTRKDSFDSSCVPMRKNRTKRYSWLVH